MAYLAGSTQQIVVGAGVRILSEVDADRVAEEMSLLDLITGGRVEFGVGLGSNQLHIKGTREEKAARFRDTLGAVLAGAPMASGAGITRGVRLVFVAPTHGEAIEASEAALNLYASLMRGGAYHREAVEAGLRAAAPESPEELRRQVNFIVGTPDEVAAQLQQYIAVTGVDRLDLMTQIPGLATQDVRPRLWPNGAASAL